MNDNFTRSVRWPLGCAMLTGRRSEMQDVISIRGRFMHRDDWDYFAIFDGHGGRQTALYCAEHLHAIFSNCLSNGDQKGVGAVTVEAAFRQAFQNCNKEIAPWNEIVSYSLLLLMMIYYLLNFNYRLFIFHQILSCKFKFKINYNII